MNPKTTIEWLDREKHPAPSGKPILFLCQIGNEKVFCVGTKDTDRDGKNVWNDESSCDRDGQPSKCRDYEVTHWALMPTFEF